MPDGATGTAKPTKGEITHLLVAWSEGDMEALDKIFPLAFEDLRRIARKCCGRIPGKDLQPTELIGEIYKTLLDQRSVHWEGRGQFYNFAALLMERVLLGYKRGLETQKRGGQATQVPLIEALDLAVLRGNRESPRGRSVRGGGGRAEACGHCSAAGHGVPPSTRLSAILVSPGTVLYVRYRDSHERNQAERTS
jgi:hypothetical protein